MTAPRYDVRTCEDARTYWGLCCIEACSDTATLAVLDHHLVEHAMCARHGVVDGDTLIASKPIVWRQP